MTFVPAVEIPTVQPVDVALKGSDFSEAPDQLSFNRKVSTAYVEHIKNMCERFNMVVMKSIDMKLVDSITFNCILFAPVDDNGAAKHFDHGQLIYRVSDHFNETDIHVTQRLFNRLDESDYIDSDPVNLNQLLASLE